ncbi:hypothetical protein [Streptomyces sp. NPDC002845]
MSDEVRTPVEAGAGVLVHSRQDREVAVRSWLLTAAQDARQARTQWQESGMALLRCGGLFGAIRISGDLVRTVAGTDSSKKIDAFLADALQGGPVFLDLYAQRYYVLVPVSAGQRYEWAARRGPEAEFLGRGCFLGVPRPECTEPEGVRSYWCVPMDGPGDLAVPDAVFQLLAAARFQRAKVEWDADE